MDYVSALRSIYERSDYERGFISNPFAGDATASLGLVRIRRTLMNLGNPDYRYPIIHVAGTKGKGSTCAMIESVARRNGLRTGLYTTPHLHTFRERIWINGEPIDEQSFVEAFEQTTEAAEQSEGHLPQIGSMTAYELTTVMALHAMAEQEVDLGIVEVGLGGRLDGTNVVPAEVSVITNISFDHQAVLGNTLSEIASEKGGIIKPGQVVVLAPQKDEAETIIRQIAAHRGAWLIREDADWTATYRDGVTRLTGPWGTMPAIELGLVGAHQAENAGTALAALWAQDPALVDELDIVELGLREVQWPGRFEIVPGNPPVVIDGAHNVASIETLIATLDERYPDKRPTILFGSSADKDIPGMMRALTRLKPKILAIASHSPRAADAHVIAEAATSASLEVEEKPSIDDALKAAQSAELIVITGSLYVVANAREALGLVEVHEEERRLFSQ